MAMERKGNSSRKPPEPAEDRSVIDDWMARLVPDLQPIVARVDELITEAHPEIQHALKWKKAYYGLPDRGWIIELVSYDVSVNVVFLGGAEFDPTPPDGSGSSRYVKLRSLEDADAPELRDWIEQAASVEGWR